jgi:hypothetical protein
MGGGFSLAKGLDKCYEYLMNGTKIAFHDTLPFRFIFAVL